MISNRGLSLVLAGSDNVYSVSKIRFNSTYTSNFSTLEVIKHTLPGSVLETMLRDDQIYHAINIWGKRLFPVP